MGRDIADCTLSITAIPRKESKGWRRGKRLLLTRVYARPWSTRERCDLAMSGRQHSRAEERCRKPQKMESWRGGVRLQARSHKSHFIFFQFHKFFICGVLLLLEGSSFLFGINIFKILIFFKIMFYHDQPCKNWPKMFTVCFAVEQGFPNSQFLHN